MLNTSPTTNRQAVYQLFYNGHAVQVQTAFDMYAPQQTAVFIPPYANAGNVIKSFNYNAKTGDIFAYRWIHEDGSINAPAAPQGAEWRRIDA